MLDTMTVSPPALRLDPQTSLSAEAALAVVAVIGLHGSGRFTSAVTLAAQLLEGGTRVVVFDSTGRWSPDSGGRRPLPLLALGGAHGDAPLDLARGEALGAALGSCQGVILTLADAAPEPRARFAAALTDALLARTADAPVAHLVFHEAQQFRRAAGLVAAHGAQRRVGATLVASRLQGLHPDATGEARYVLAHRLTGPRDRQAFAAYVPTPHGPDLRAQLAQLASLDSGCALLWSAAAPGRLREVAVVARTELHERPSGRAGAELLAAAAGDGATAAPAPSRRADRLSALTARVETLEQRVAQLEDVPHSAPAGPATADHDLDGYRLGVLCAIAQAGACARPRAALLAGRAWRSRAFKAALHTLVAHGLVLESAGDEPGLLSVSEAGRALAAQQGRGPFADGPDLVRRWCQILAGGRRRLLQDLLEAHPAAVAAPDVGAAGALRSLGLARNADAPGALALSLHCGLEGAP